MFILNNFIMENDLFCPNFCRIVSHQKSFLRGIAMAAAPAIPGWVSFPTSLNLLCTFSSKILSLLDAGDGGRVGSSMPGRFIEVGASWGLIDLRQIFRKVAGEEILVKYSW